MASEGMRIIFMGTPEFAVPGLQTLLDHSKHVVAVVTAPDKPAGRGLKLQESAVKQLALANNIPVLQPLNLKAPEFIEELRSFHADLQIVIAFRMLPEAVWNMPPRGTFNLHASLLPQYRGAAPINWAIINGEKVTGVTTFFLQHEIDTGNIIFQEKAPILPEDNFETLYHKLMHLGGRLVLKTVNAIEENNSPSMPQQFQDTLKSAPKIHKDTCQINWNQTTEAVHNFVRGLAPYPAAWTVLEGKAFKIFRTKKVENLSENVPGSIHTDGKTYLHVATRDGAMSLLELQAEGKKRMVIDEFLRGNKLQSSN